MKKLFIVLLTLGLIISLSACSQSKSVKHIPLTKAEQKIANLSTDIIKKFSLAKGNVYDISMYLYKNGTGISIGGVYGVDPNENGGVVYISGSRTGDVGFMWGISDGGAVARFPALEVEDSRAFMMLDGAGQSEFNMDPKKEYVLMFSAFKEGNSVSASETDVFHTWDMFEDKSELMSKFDYAYVITIKLSDLPGNG